MSQEALLSLFQPPKIDEIKKILCIQPHPDDNEIGMGGIISYLTSKGVQVDYLTVTDGSLGDIGIIEGDLKEDVDFKRYIKEHFEVEPENLFAY